MREASPGVESQSLVPFYSSHLPWPAQEDSEERGPKQPDPEKSRADLLRICERHSPTASQSLQEQTHGVPLSCQGPYGVVAKSPGSGLKETWVQILALLSSNLRNFEQVT